MLDEARIASIEAAITAQEAEGKDWTNQSVYNVVGGNYGELSPVPEGPACPDPAPWAWGRARPRPSQKRRLRRKRRRRSRRNWTRPGWPTATRAAGWRSCGARATRCSCRRTKKRRCSGWRPAASAWQPVLERLHTELLAQQEHTDVEAFRQGWQPLVDAKVQAYTLFAEAVRRLWWAVQGLHAIHLRQEQAIDTLPPRLARKLHDDFLPDAATIRKRLSGVMQPSRGWDMVLNTPPTLPTAEELMANDPGVRAVPPRLLPNIMEGRL